MKALVTPTLKVETESRYPLLFGPLDPAWQATEVGDRLRMNGAGMSWPMTVTRVNMSRDGDVLIVVKPD